MLLTRFLAVAALTLATTTVGYSQSPVPNGELEEWTLYPGQSPFKSYEEPNDGWSSGNGAIHVAPNSDPVCEKSSDAYSGMWSAKLTTRKIFNQIASGSLYLGKFKLNLANPRESAQLGIPYSNRPFMFKGFFKFLPEGGDSAVIRATLRRWTGQNTEVVGEAKLIVYSKIESWTPFDIVFEYANGEVPDTLEIAFASSAGGEFFRGDPGSTLFIDAISFADEATSVGPEISKARSIQWISSINTLRVDQTLVNKPYRIIDLYGRVVRTGTFRNEDIYVENLPRGWYAIWAPDETLVFVK